MSPLKITLLIVLALLVFVFARLGELYTQLSRYQKYWDQNNQSPIEKEDVVYIAFGDSAAQGVGASEPEKGYVGLIGAELKDKTGKNVRIINLSKSGGKISDVLQSQLPKYEKLGLKNKTFITMEIGANDILSFDEQKFEKEMDELMARLPKHIVMSDVPSFAGSRLAKYESKVNQANAIIHKLAPKHGLKIVNLYDRVKTNKGLRTFSADIFHPSDYGYQTNWLASFMPELEKQL